MQPNTEDQEFLIESFRNSLTSMKRDFLGNLLYSLLLECECQGISVSLFLEALGDAIGQSRTGHEWRQCLLKLEHASYGATEAERAKHLSRSSPNS